MNGFVGGEQPSSGFTMDTGMQAQLKALNLVKSADLGHCGTFASRPHLQFETVGQDLGDLLQREG